MTNIWVVIEVTADGTSTFSAAYRTKEKAIEAVLADWVSRFYEGEETPELREGAPNHLDYIDTILPDEAVLTAGGSWEGETMFHVKQLRVAE